MKQPKFGKLSPYHPVPLTVTSKNHSMLTAEGGDQKVTRNSSHSKKFLSDEPASSLSDVDIPGPLPFPVSASQEDTGPVLVGPNSSARTPADPHVCPNRPRGSFERYDQTLGLTLLLRLIALNSSTTLGFCVT